MTLITAPLFAGDYSVASTLEDGIPVVRLTDAAHGVEVAIAPTIGNIAFEMKVKGKNIFWTPFKTLSEFKEKPALCGNPLLAPWANRLSRDGFSFGSRDYSLNPAIGNIRRDGNGHPIHGLLIFSPLWEVVEQTADGQQALVRSRLEYWRYPELMEQFPFAHTLEMTYRLSNGTLEVETVLNNHSSTEMPVSIGYHPYFQLHDAPRDDWKVTLAAKAKYELSAELIPTGVTAPLTLRNPVELSGTQLDDVFGSLTRGSNGRADFSVRGKSQSITVSYGPKYPVAVVYAPPGRGFICFEPMTAVTDAINLSHAGKYKDLQSIPPGGVWKESFWISTSGF